MDLETIDKRLDRIEGKLDNHLERVSKLEEGLKSVRGYIKVGLSIMTAIVAGVIKVLIGSHLK